MPKDIRSAYWKKENHKYEKKIKHKNEQLEKVKFIEDSLPLFYYILREDCSDFF